MTKWYLPVENPTLLLFWLILLFLADSSACWLSDRGIRGRLQSQGAEGGPAGWDGAMGRHPHDPPCAGTQPQDLSIAERAARVRLNFAYTSLIRLFWSCGQRAAAAVVQCSALRDDVKSHLLCKLLFFVACFVAENAFFKCLASDEEPNHSAVTPHAVFDHLLATPR